MGTSDVQFSPVYTPAYSEKGPMDSSPAGILSQAAGKGKLMVPPFNPYTVTDTGASYTITPDGGSPVAIPKGTTSAQLTKEQAGALAAVENLLGRLDKAETPTPVAVQPKGDAQPHEKVDVKPAPKTTFDPTASAINSRFDATIGRTDLQAAGTGKHYLSAADAAAVCQALGYADVRAMQTALGKGLTPPLAVDGKLGGRTLQALTAKVLADKTFAFPAISSADDAKAFARVSELLVEQASTTESATATTELKDRLTAALGTAIGKAPADVQTAITAAAAGMTSTATGEGDAADAKTILTTSAKPDAGKVAGMSVDELITTMARPGALDGDSGTAIRARLEDPAVLLAVAGNATAMGNPTIAAEVVKAVACLDAAGLNSVAKGLGKAAPESVQKALLAQIDVLAGKLATPADVDTLVSLRESWFAVRPSDTLPASFDEAAGRMIKAAALSDLQETDGVKPPFLEKLSQVHAGGPLPKDLTAAIATRVGDLKSAAKDKVIDDRTSLGKSPEVDKVYWQIRGRMDDGIHGREDDDINALIKELGEVDSHGNLSETGSARVGALIERLKADGKLDRLIDDYGRSERKDLLRILAHVHGSSVSAETVGQLARRCEDKLGSDDGATKAIKATATALLSHTDGAGKADMLRQMRGEPDLARGFVTNKENFPYLVDAFPDGHVASEFMATFKTDGQRVGFMNHLIDVIADPREAETTRKWAMAALENATVAFRQPLEDGDLSDVQDHLNAVNAGAGVPAESVTWLAKFHKVLEHEKSIN